MANPTPRKNEQISLSQYEQLKAKKGKRKPILDIPGPVSLIFVVPLVFFIILIVGYIVYIQRLAAH